MRAAPDHPLADPGELHGAPGVDAPGTGAVLTRHLADPRVDAETVQRPGHDRRQDLEPVSGALDGSRLRARPGEGERALGEDRRASSGESEDGLEARRSRGLDRGLKPAGGSILLRERKLAAGAVEAQRRRQLARGNPLQQRLGDRGAEGGAIRESLS